MSLDRRGGFIYAKRQHSRILTRSNLVLRSNTAQEGVDPVNARLHPVPTPRHRPASSILHVVLAVRRNAASKHPDSRPPDENNTLRLSHRMARCDS